MMKASMIVIAVGACSLAMAACTVTSQGPVGYQPTAGGTGSETAHLGAAPNISPTDPAYSENGAPRAGEPSGVDTAGAPSASGNYAPIQHQHDQGGGGFAQ
jgi:hypothetical protein